MKHKQIMVGYSNAVFSDCKNHRFALWRSWKTDPIILFVGLNPSRANEFYNDPTIIRCINFAKSFGYGSMLFANLFSRISPDPALVKNDLENANHIRHDVYLQTMMAVADAVVFCWGSWEFIDDRKKKVVELAREFHKFPIKCFGHNADGNPKHPLYLKSDVQLQLYHNEKK